MATYTVATKGLEGVILLIQPHYDASLPVLHHTFNAVYGVDLYETEFHFIFDDVPTNELTELYKNALKQLLDHMIIHIMTKSGSIGTGSKMDKVEKLFKTMQLSYKMHNGTYVFFK